MRRFLLPADYVVYNGAGADPWPLDESLAYTRWLARSHYENFHVASFLLPRRLHQDFYNLYAFCRWADDLGDEIGDPLRSLELLEEWRLGLAAMYAGEARHPVFVALRTTVERFGMPQQPFADLIHAFVQDQTVTRYQSWDQLLEYCVYSANPVGRLVLHLCGYTDDQRRELSDFTCTALQLANHWQDVGRDWEKGRVYIPLDAMAKHRYSVEALERDIAQGQASEPFRAVLKDLGGRARELFLKGLPLVDSVDRRLAVDLDLFSRGGMAILDRIAAQNYDVIAQRPVIGKAAKGVLLLKALGRRAMPKPLREAQHAYR
ncbi:MAG: squalene synthase HpnC [Bryobacterales bacterium]